MSEEVEVRKSDAVVPLLGLVVDLTKPDEVAQALRAVREAKRKLDEVRGELEFILAEEASRLGTKTLHVKGGTVTITGGPEVEYDVEVLAELLEAGLPQERYDELVKAMVTYKVDRRVVRQLLGSGNADYVRIVENAAQNVERPWRVSVK